MGVPGLRAVVTVTLVIALWTQAVPVGASLTADTAEIAAAREQVARNPRALKEPFRLGLLLSREGRQDDAIAIWRAILREHSETLSFGARVRLFYAVGVAHYRAGRFKRAEAVLQRCREMAPNSPKIATAWQAAHNAAANPPEVVADPPPPTPTPTGSSAPPPPPPCPDKGKAAFDDGNATFSQVLVLIEQAQDEDKALESCIQSLEAARRCGWRPERAAFLLGSALLRRAGDGDAAQAVKLLEESAAKDEDAKTYLELGTAHDLSGNSPAAIAAYEKALVLDPDWDEAHFRVAVAYDKSGRADAPRHTFEHAKAAIRKNGARYKPRFQSMLRNSEVAAKISKLVGDVIARSEAGDLSDDDVDKIAHEFETMLGPNAGKDMKEEVRKLLTSPKAKEILKTLPPEERKRLMETPEGQKELYARIVKAGITPKR